MRLLVFITFLALLTGCFAPPGVPPALRVVQRTLQAEAAALEGDAARDTADADHARALLAAGFDADLAAQSNLTAAWVRDAAAAWSLGREQLARQELQTQQARLQRQTNLQQAAALQQRVLDLLEKQRDLLGRGKVGEFLNVTPYGEQP